MLTMVMVVATGLLDLAEGLLGRGEVAVLEGRGKGGEGTLGSATLAFPGRGCVPRPPGLECRKGVLGYGQITCLQGLPELIEQGLHLREGTRLRSLGILSTGVVMMPPALRNLGEGILGRGEVTLL